jgi:hypothetical protein
MTKEIYPYKVTLNRHYKMTSIFCFISQQKYILAHVLQSEKYKGSTFESLEIYNLLWKGGA